MRKRYTRSIDDSSSGPSFLPLESLTSLILTGRKCLVEQGWLHGIVRVILARDTIPGLEVSGLSGTVCSLLFATWRNGFWRGLRAIGVRA